ncbi:hypothetical protein [Pseudophaeobacter sp.]|uniref:hypothetical protein n=1 Tax=Pseudophaeobacter sp. TaxID=1971739 RepID=UPI003A987F20
MLPIEVIFTDCRLRVSHCRRNSGATGQTLISFTSIGHHLGGIEVQKPEFFAAGTGYDDILFVDDLQKSWGSKINFDLLLREIAPFTTGKKVDTLGNSMGGFLAFLAPRFFDVRHAVAFVPQIDTNFSALPWEGRLDNFLPGLRRWDYSCVAGHLVDQTKYIAFTGTVAQDIKHLDLLPQSDNIEIFQLPIEKHIIPRILKAHGLLDTLVRSALSGTITPDWFQDEIIRPLLSRPRIDPESLQRPSAFIPST